MTQRRTLSGSSILEEAVESSSCVKPHASAEALQFCARSRFSLRPTEPDHEGTASSSQASVTSHRQHTDFLGRSLSPSSPPPSSSIMSGRFFRSVSDSEDSSSSSDEELMSDSEDEQQEKKTTTSTAAPKKQSRFLKTAGGSDDSSSESEDSDDDDDDSDEDSDDSDKPKKAAAGGAAGQAPKVSRFMRGAASDDSDSDSDDDEVKKVIRSAKDKRTDEVDAVVKTIDNAQRIDDWVAISKEYDNLLRLFDRQKNMNELVPVSFYRCLSGLEEFLNQTVAAGKSKKMKAPNAKAMNGMKSKLKKAIKDHDDEISKYRAVSSTHCEFLHRPVHHLTHSSS